MVFLEAVRKVMRPDGILIMRFFVQKDQPQRPEVVFRDLAEGKIGSFHVLKWRLAMALQSTTRDGVRVDDVWKAWKEAGITTDWPRQAVETIETYRGSDHRLTFTTLREIRDLHASHFEERACSTPGYELGERCPILVHSQR
jgi:hypothetical protein